MDSNNNNDNNNSDSNDEIIESNGSNTSNNNSRIPSPPPNNASFEIPALIRSSSSGRVLMNNITSFDENDNEENNNQNNQNNQIKKKRGSSLQRCPTIKRRSTTVGVDGCALPSAFYCPLTLSVMRIPVIDREGNSYEKSAIENWLSQNCSSPITRKPLRFKDLSFNRNLSDLIEERMGNEWIREKQLFTQENNNHNQSDVLNEEDGFVDVNVQDEFGHNNNNNGVHFTNFPLGESRRIVSSFLNEISQDVGKTISLNSDGRCAFTYDKFTIVIEVPDSIRSFFIHTELNNNDDTTTTSSSSNQNNNVTLTEKQKLKMYEKMLQLNYLQQETRGGCLSLSPLPLHSSPSSSTEPSSLPDNDHHKITFSYTDRIDEIDAHDFRNILENFIDSAMRLHEELFS